VVVAASSPTAFAAAASRVRELVAGYTPPDFAEVPGPDAALFLCAIDHRTGYRGTYLVGGSGPYEGSDLLWQLGSAAEQRRPGALTADRLAEVDATTVAAMFRIGGETVADPERRARLLRDLASRLREHYGGSAAALLAACEGRLGGQGGLIVRLAEFEAYSDPLAKKSFLFAKIAGRRGWLTVADPENWEVCADNVLMRLALRAGLVEPGEPEIVRAATRAALKRLAVEAGVEPPILDDLLWQLGRHDADLLGSAGGEELREPPRPQGTVFY
jgi:hypothetical protein